MKKITILALHLNFGGVEKYISSLCKMLEDDCDIELIVTYRSKPAFDFSRKIKIRYLIDGMPNKDEFKKSLKNKQIFKTFKEGIIAAKMLLLKRILNIKAIKNIESDYIITTREFHSKLVGKYAKKNIVKIATEHNYHNNDVKYVNKLLKSVANFNFLVVVSNELKEYYNKLSKTKVVYIPNTIDFIPKEKSKLNKNNIVAVGRFSKEKGFVDLIDVFKLVNNEIDDSKLYLIGDGNQMPLIKEKIDNYGLNGKVILTGFLSQSEIKNFYLESKLYVMTSYTESFGLVLIEAMSYGLPCVAFDCASGAREIINENNGVLISDRNSQDMAKEIIKLFKDSERLKKLAAQTLNTCKKYSMDEVKQKWMNLLEDKK